MIDGECTTWHEWMGKNMDAAMASDRSFMQDDDHATEAMDLFIEIQLRVTMPADMRETLMRMCERIREHRETYIGSTQFLRAEQRTDERRKGLVTK